MAPHLFKGLLVWFRKWAAICLRASLHGVIPLCKSLKSGHSWTSCLENGQLLSQSWQELICQSVTAQVPQCFAPSTTNWSICKNVTNYILILRFHDDLECKTWVHNYFCISIRDRWLNRWPTILLRDCLCGIIDGPQSTHRLACVGSQMARNHVTDYIFP